MRILWALIFSLLSSLALAAPQDLGLGISIGNPTGFNGKYWLTEEQAVDAGLAYSLGKNSEVSIHSDYLLHEKSYFYFNETYPLDLYYGIGGRMEFGNDVEFGARTPVGVVHNFTERPADMFFEVAPIFDFMGRTGVELHFLVGARFYFTRP